MRILIASILGVVLLALVAYTQRPNLQTPFTNNTPSITASSTEKIVYDLDSDADGLKDWEETLWGTDPKNPDTDGDGIDDTTAVEIRRGISPHEPVEYTPATYQQIAERIQPKRASSWDMQKLLEYVLPKGSDTPAPDPAHVQYKIYGNELARALTEHVSLNATEAPTFQAIIKKTVDQALFEELERIADRYTKTSASLGSIVAPEDMALLGKNLTDAYLNQSTHILRLSTFKAQGFIAPEAFTPYSQSVLASGRALIAIAQFLSSKGIVYGSNEPGAIWSLPQ